MIPWALAEIFIEGRGDPKKGPPHGEKAWKKKVLSSKKSPHRENDLQY